MIYHLSYTIKVDFTNIVDGVSSCKVSAYDCLDRFVGEQSFVQGDQATFHLHTDVSMPLSKVEMSLLIGILNTIDTPVLQSYLMAHKEQFELLREHLQSIYFDYCGDCEFVTMSLPNVCESDTDKESEQRSE